GITIIMKRMGSGLLVGRGWVRFGSFCGDVERAWPDSTRGAGFCRESVAKGVGGGDDAGAGGGGGSSGLPSAARGSRPLGRQDGCRATTGVDVGEEPCLLPRAEGACDG